MRPSELRRYLPGAASFLVAYLVAQIFLLPAWHFAVGCVLRWWRHGGPLDLGLGLLIAPFYGAWSDNRRAQARARAVPGAGVGRRAA